MADHWSEIRGWLLAYLNEHYPDMDFEERVIRAEDAAREVLARKESDR